MKLYVTRHTGCHLDLCLENILLKDCRFITKKDGSVHFPDMLSIKICDFGVAEIFNHQNPNNFRCNKQGLTIQNEILLSPNVFHEEIYDNYDARTADMWSLGMIFYQCMTGQKLYNAADKSITKDSNLLSNGYWAVINDKLKSFVHNNGLEKYFKTKAFNVLRGLLMIDENKRLTAKQFCEHLWFKSYLNAYKQRIDAKFVQDMERLMEQKDEMAKHFPYYKM